MNSSMDAIYWILFNLTESPSKDIILWLTQMNNYFFLFFFYLFPLHFDITTT